MVEFNVPDMTCSSCAQRIRRAIAEARLPEGFEADIDVAARQIRIAGHVKDETAELVRSAIERAGYRADAAVAPSSRQTSSGCCCASRSATPADMSQDGAGRPSSCCS